MTLSTCQRPRIWESTFAANSGVYFEALDINYFSGANLSDVCRSLWEAKDYSQDLICRERGEDVDAVVVKMLVRSDLSKGLLRRFWIVLDFETRLNFAADDGTDIGVRVFFPSQGQFLERICESIVKVPFRTLRSLKCPRSRVWLETRTEPWSRFAMLLLKMSCTSFECLRWKRSWRRALVRRCDECAWA